MCYDGFVEKMYENLESAHRFIEKKRTTAPVFYKTGKKFQITKGEIVDTYCISDDEEMESVALNGNATAVQMVEPTATNSGISTQIANEPLATRDQSQLEGYQPMDASDDGIEAEIEPSNGTNPSGEQEFATKMNEDLNHQDNVSMHCYSSCLLH